MRTLLLVILALVVIAFVLVAAEEAAKKKKAAPKHKAKAKSGSKGKKKAPAKKTKKSKSKSKSKSKPKSKSKSKVTKGKLPACHPPGHAAGKCIDNSKGTCCPAGTKYVEGDYCPGHSNKATVVCCAKDGSGKKTPAKKGKKPAKKPAKKGKKPAKKSSKKTKGWSREDAVTVAKTWLKYKKRTPFAEVPKVKQYITHGKGNYRTDCSGFVSACWNAPPPGFTTYSVKYKKIKRANMIRGDAMLCSLCYRGIHHIALFWGWAKDGRVVVVEEYNYGHTVSMRAWDNSWGQHFSSVRRIGW